MISIIGGTGPEGQGLALRLAMAGEQIFIGSREESRGKEIAEQILEIKNIPPITVNGGSNLQAAKHGEIVIIATPYAGHKQTLIDYAKLLKNNIVIDVVVPFSFSKGQISTLPVSEVSVAEEAQEILKESKVVGAFHNVSAEDLLIPNKMMDCDVIICSNDQNSTNKVIELAEKIGGLRGIDGGKLHNSRYVEDFTAHFININKIYKTHSSIKISGI
ncbi:MAG: NADPH-dependent F420 reductase [SAR202 cluster bacterium]|nr:NADPH-dependent F420 reductase [SAR202 cluster bacterium]